MRCELCARGKYICVLELFQLVQLHELIKWRLWLLAPSKFNWFLWNFCLMASLRFVHVCKTLPYWEGGRETQLPRHRCLESFWGVKGVSLGIQLLWSAASLLPALWWICGNSANPLGTLRVSNTSQYFPLSYWMLP